MKERPEHAGEAEQAGEEGQGDARTHTFLVYDAKSGDLVHGHKALILPYGEAPSEKELNEEALRLASEVTGRKPDELRTLSVAEEELEPGFVYRVNPDTERLERADGGEAAA